MEDQNQTSFTFMIDNLSDKRIESPKFLNGSYEWVVDVYSKEEDHKLNVYHFLMVANPESLRPGFVIRVSFFFVMLNQSGKELYRTKEMCKLFCDKVCDEAKGWGCYESLPLEFETNKIILKLEIVKVVEVVDWNEMIEFNGFQIHYSQNELLKTTYMNVLLALVETLNKPQHSLTETELSNARSDLVELTEAGFKLNWLKTMLDEVSFDGNKGNFADHGSQVEQHIKEKVEAARDWLEDSSVYPKLSSVTVSFSIHMVLGELYGQVAESDDVIRKPSLVAWLQSLTYLCSNKWTQGSASGPTIDTSN
ncbi:hypothetical protein BRARA_G03221 [Brassica rapa]|uniref:MATH domain-containing protein n=1 Tax=Brassica campestris TaxID=3711 RepID=A0A397YTI5_BRACM|nr:hypothetical protein BRARA_G03221 [Brassica rapa]